MAGTTRESAVIVRVSVPPAIARTRVRWDLSARLGVPPHVTILYPFVPADGLTPEVRSALATEAGDFEPFEVRFKRVERWPGVVYLAPMPAASFTALTNAVAQRFPGHPPYEGEFDEVVPHLTVVEVGEDDDGVDLEAIALEAGRWLPFDVRVGRLEVIAEGHNGRWSTRWRIPLGVRP